MTKSRKLSTLMASFYLYVITEQKMCYHGIKGIVTYGIMVSIKFIIRKNDNTHY